MKRIILPIALLVSSGIRAQITAPTVPVNDSFYALAPVEVKAVRAGEKAPFTKTNLSAAEISRNNLGQDIPFLLNQTPSVVVNSDAGNGFGYTGIRIRGSDPTRINVTLNGIPYNDAESQGTFFVDLPDFSSSTSSIQVQRGVGTSSNGAGAFGGSINFSTNESNDKAFLFLSNGFGSFNSWKNTLRAGTGWVKGFSTEIRLSHISSDGYIDRASTDLNALHFSTAWRNKKTGLRLNIFTGKEKTYQAWNGVSEADLLAGHRRVNSAGTEKPGDPYANETDNYRQTHYQFFLNQQLQTHITFNTALFLTRGKGYYEQYKSQQAYSKYGLPDVITPGGPVTKSYMVRQLWLDNYYYGAIYSFQYKRGGTQATLGGALTRYDGNHYGKIIWAEQGLAAPHRWYDLDATKSDATVYLKQQSTVASYWNLFYDLQYRYVNYRTDGFRDNPDLPVQVHYHFFNPKAGISYTRNGWKSYASIALASKEPNRDDFEAGAGLRPVPEHLVDVELGVERNLARYSWGATIYYMDYKNQLVLTGKINDVGAYTRSNIPSSYRLGIELQGAARFCKWLNAAANLSLSRNELKNFTEYIDDYDNNNQKATFYSRSDISFSPGVVGSATINILPAKHMSIGLSGKYVGRQYLDNTARNDRSLRAFYVQDIRLGYDLQQWKKLHGISLVFQLNNVFGKKYEPNGYTYSYVAGGQTVTENYYFPMAGTNFLAGITFQLQ